MKRLFLLLFFLCALTVESFGIVTYVTLKKGEYYNLNASSVYYNYFEIGNFLVTGDAVTVEYHRPSDNTAIHIHAVASGYGALVTRTSTNNKVRYTYIFHVIDVVDIDIPKEVDLIMNESFTYTPIITDAEAETILSWTSSNTAIATIDENGVVMGISPGKTTITCTAENGVKAQSVVTVSPLLASNVTLNCNKQEMNVGENYKLSATIAPEGVNSKQVCWLSTNDNIAQVDDEGNVTAIGPGYCTIYAKADDGSGKFAKCLVHVNGASGVRGDMNGDGQVTVTDASEVIDIILDK